MTFGGLATVTAGTPAACTTVNDASELVAASLAATAAAAAIFSLTVAVAAGGGGVGVTGAGSLPPPQATNRDSSSPEAKCRTQDKLIIFFSTSFNHHRPNRLVRLARTVGGTLCI
ncbi:MAG: hypothetical protein Q7U26_03085 [Aquabacterium sp.]|nr:hypothetical protein [Aquabacterium sp.]